QCHSRQAPMSFPPSPNVIPVKTGIPHDLSISPILGAQGIVLGRLIARRDAAERKRAEAQMFQRQQTWAVLDERERLEREIAERLHSSVQSRLLVVCLQLQQCEDLDEGERSKARAILAKARDFIES
ncbi:MAG: hypothetical protein Q8R28_14590, partial [Dehalococcoidia bacterium]|nr:hypothetical protein [Dehalococcoidia bacterium]